MKKIAFDTSFLCLLMVAFAFQTPITIAASYIIALVYIINERKYISINKVDALVFSGAALICLPAAASLNHGIAPIFYLAVAPIIFIAAQQLSKKDHGHILLCLKYFYWIFVFAIAIGLAAHWGDPEPFELMIPGAGGNGLPSYLIVVQIGYSLTSYLKFNRLPIASSIATLLVAFFGLGRGSILIGALILIFSIFVNASTSKSDRKITIRFVGIIALLLSVYLYSNYEKIGSALELLIEQSKFSQGVFDESRGQIIADYMNKINEWTLIFGASYDNTSIAHYFDGNPHNSFIRVHSFYGVAGLIFVLTTPIFIAISNRLVTQKIVAICLIFFAWIRATTEPIFFPSTLDFFYLFYFFIFFRFAQQKQKQLRIACLQN
ncbi:MULTISPECIES: hypothetical protein [Comamonadaceae]|uniref:hypothetical protein n=1 Tax=Comamonadaceae TaxID=80864 RepID=UPI002719225E|nr:MULTISPECIES: hypothetical protein [Comamonadaceae]MDO9145882.1 hypothetical protein [Rhodoferax sp.]MDP3887623.1 hypothetical protein [Hydrogenophaga sp.]